MTPEEQRHARVAGLFQSALEHPVGERPHFLRHACQGDPGLLAEVQALLNADADLEGNAALSTTVPLSKTATHHLDLAEGPLPSLLDQRYRLERLIGRGGFGIVYLARDERLHNKPVVVKFLIGETRRDEWFRKKFRDEIEALSRLDHPGIVGILDAGQTPAGTPYLVMQYVEGVTLRSLIMPGGLDLPTTAYIVQDIGRALAAAHSRGVFHRDLKPENIMVQSDETGHVRLARLIDFGIATIREQGFERAAEPTRVAGSLSYMAPEQFRGQPAGASDIFAMGVIAWELLAGKLPFRNRSPVQAMAQPNFLEELDELLHLRPEIPGAALAVIRKALAIEPADRFQTATAFGNELAQALRTPSVAPQTPPLQQRMLDVAMARQIPIHKPAEVMALIRRGGSGGLAAVLQVEEDHSVTKEDIRSKPFQLEFPLAPSGALKPLELGLRLECPDFEPKTVSKTLLVPPAGDSDACTFLITPQHLGELRVNVELTRGDVLLASRALKTESTPSDRKIADPSKILVSIPLSVLVRASEGASAGEFTRMLQPPAFPAAPIPSPPAGIQAGEFTALLGKSVGQGLPPPTVSREHTEGVQTPPAPRIATAAVAPASQPLNAAAIPPDRSAVRSLAIGGAVGAALSILIIAVGILVVPHRTGPLQIAQVRNGSETPLPRPPGVAPKADRQRQEAFKEVPEAQRRALEELARREAAVQVAKETAAPKENASLEPRVAQPPPSPTPPQPPPPANREPVLPAREQPGKEPPAPAPLPPKIEVTAAAKSAQRDTVPTNTRDREEYVHIKPGKFKMGCVPSDQKCGPEENPQHEVVISKGFWMGRTEVEVSAYKKFSEAKKVKMPSAPNDNRGWRASSYPMVLVPWDQAKAYCEWAGGRLPTEAEWEYAYRAGGTDQIYPLNDENSRDKANFYGTKGNDNFEGSAPVHSFDANPFNLFDMAGNVWEWTQDFYSPTYYSESPALDPQGPKTGKEHVMRGGSFESKWQDHLRLSARKSQSGPAYNVGFRCVLEDSDATQKLLNLVK